MFRIVHLNTATRFDRWSHKHAHNWLSFLTWKWGLDSDFVKLWLLKGPHYLFYLLQHI